MEEHVLKTKIMTVWERIKGLVITDKQSYQTAGEIIIDLDHLIKQIKEYWKEPKERAFQAHKAITAKESEMLRPVTDRRNDLAGKIKKYLTEQDKIRREEQSRLDAERMKREQAERDRLAKRAEKADEKGNAEKAEALREKINDVFVAPSIVVPDVEKTTRMDTGTVSVTKDIEVTITDEKALIAEMAAGNVPVSVVTFSVPKLKAYIRLQGLTKLNGVTIADVSSAKFRGK